MSDIQQNNKRIAKNTLLLYIRMLLLMLISLYTSRVILNTLGVVDYGIYNVVGGIIVMFSFLSGSLSAASSRFITYDLGRGDIFMMKKTFGNIVAIHILLAMLILILGETIGLWFVMHKLQIPENRMVAALWVYQFSIFSFVLNIVSIPYNAAIIAHEQMTVFAYISIVDAIVKLLIVYLLVVIPYDKLIMYAFLFFCVQVLDGIVYGVYSIRHFAETKSKIILDKQQFKKILSFSIWTMNGCLAVVGYTQGINILLNIFFGPSVNAARGVAVQVQSVVQNFCNNFQMALNPQITKSYAQNDLKYMQQLLKVSSKFSFFLLYIISLPLMLEAPLVLKWWLGIVPEYTVSFLRLILCATMLVALSRPLVTSVHATGRIRKFQLIEGTMLLCIVPIAYVLLKFWHISPEYVFFIHIMVELLTQYARIKIVLPMISMQIVDYIKDVLFPILKVLVVSLIFPLIVYNFLIQSIGSFFIVCVVSVLSVLISVYFWGCSISERNYIVEKIKLLKKYGAS